MSTAKQLMCVGIGLLLGTLAFAGGIAAQVTWSKPTNHNVYWVSCPTEDSCTIDYRDGAWRIERVDP